MAAQCRNYMQQYSRTKSIREINKSRSSYKQLLQGSKTRESSITTAQLKLSHKKPSCEKIEKCHNGQYRGNAENCGNTSGFDNLGACGCAQPLLSSTQNVQNIINISYGKLNSKMKLKVTAEKNIRSMSSQEQLMKSQNSLVVSSMANIGMGVGLSNQKKKPKLVTLSSYQNGLTSSTTKKPKNYNELTSISQHDHEHSLYNEKSISKSRQKSKQKSACKSYNASAINSKYSTSMAHQAAYSSIKKEIQGRGSFTNNKSGTGKGKEKGNQSGNVEIVTINSSMLLSKGGEGRRDNLEAVYDRVKSILQANSQKQKQWQVQRNYYQTRIKQLQKQLSQAHKKSTLNQKQHNPSHSAYSSIIAEEPAHKYSNRTTNQSLFSNFN